MLSGAGNPEITEIDDADVAVVPYAWPFAVSRRAEIDRHFSERQRRQPAVWNGRIILVSRWHIEDGVLRGAGFETDYASFLAWRDWDFPDRGVFNIFAPAALRAADGAYLVGEMAPHTAGAGAIYFPCGTPDPLDVGADGRLDLAGSLNRELLEETGLDIGTLHLPRGWTMVHDRGFLGLIREVTAPENADALRARVMRHLAKDAHAEFCDIHVVRSPADLDPRMPRFMVAFLEEAWRR
jgi:hypothetical protein